MDQGAESIVRRFAEVILAGDFAALHQLLSAARQSENSPQQLAERLSPEAVHRFLCAEMVADPGEVHRIPVPTAYRVGALPNHEVPSEFPEAKFRGWYCIQFRPDNDSVYQSCYEIAVMLADDDGWLAVDRFELMWPD